MVSTVIIRLDEKMNAGYLIKIEINSLLIDCNVLDLKTFLCHESPYLIDLKHEKTFAFLILSGK